MNITVFGANGNIGSRVVALLLEQNHNMTAFVHGSNLLPDHKNLTIIQGSIYEKGDVEGALKSAEAVISTLGSWGTPKKDVLSSAMQNIIPVMQQKNIDRIITLTGTDADASYDKKTLFHTLLRTALKIMAGKILVDGDAHLRQLEASNLSWTVLRSPVMNNKGKSTYTLTKKRPYIWQTINRDAVAQAIVDQLTTSGSIKKAPFIARQR